LARAAAKMEVNFVLMDVECLWLTACNALPTWILKLLDCMNTETKIHNAIYAWVQVLQDHEALEAQVFFAVNRDGYMDHSLQDTAHAWVQVLRDHETFEAQVEGLKRKQAGHAKERLLHEKKIKKLQGEKDKKVGGSRMVLEGMRVHTISISGLRTGVSFFP